MALMRRNIGNVLRSVAKRGRIAKRKYQQRTQPPRTGGVKHTGPTKPGIRKHAPIRKQAPIRGHTRRMEVANQNAQFKRSAAGKGGGEAAAIRQALRPTQKNRRKLGSKHVGKGGSKPMGKGRSGVRPDTPRGRHAAMGGRALQAAGRGLGAGISGRSNIGFNNRRRGGGR